MTVTRTAAAEKLRHVSIYELLIPKSLDELKKFFVMFSKLSNLGLESRNDYKALYVKRALKGDIKFWDEIFSDPNRLPELKKFFKILSEKEVDAMFRLYDQVSNNEKIIYRSYNSIQSALKALTMFTIRLAVAGYEGQKKQTKQNFLLSSGK